ncbi:unnamed protein product [Dicrocoelium dendriticum]|nr:unnamed protein product [Dicrocoelium dendriticum]
MVDMPGPLVLSDHYLIYNLTLFSDNRSDGPPSRSLEVSCVHQFTDLKPTKSPFLLFVRLSAVFFITSRNQAIKYRSNFSSEEAFRRRLPFWCVWIRSVAIHSQERLDYIS